MKAEYRAALPASDERGEHERRRSLAGSRDQRDDMHPLSVITAASGVRLDDPLLEQERVVLVGAALVAGRDAARTLDQWLRRSLADYHESQVTQDLACETAQLRLSLDRFDDTLRQMATRLQALIPGIGRTALASELHSGVRARSLPAFMHEVSASSRILLAATAIGAQSTTLDEQHPPG
jgi:hypothetical protein